MEDETDAIPTSLAELARIGRNIAMRAGDVELALRLDHLARESSE